MHFAQAASYIRCPPTGIFCPAQGTQFGQSESCPAYRSTTASRTIREFCEAVQFTGQSLRSAIGNHIAAWGWSILSGVSQRCCCSKGYGLPSASRSNRTDIASPAQNETNEMVGIGFGPAESSTGWRHPQQGSLGRWAEDETLKWLVPLTATQPEADLCISHLLGISSTPTRTRGASLRTSRPRLLKRFATGSSRSLELQRRSATSTFLSSTSVTSVSMFRFRFDGPVTSSSKMRPRR